VKIDLDLWLASIFGYDVFKVMPPITEVADLSVYTLHARIQQDRAFYYTKLATDCIAVMSQFVSSGFRVVDVNITFERRPMKVESPSIAVREALPQDESDVLAIAETCFVYSRFHLDPLISNETAHKIKRKWIGSYFRGQRGEKLFVAEFDGKVVGFNAVLKTTDNARVIDLIGVDKTYQGRGVGRALVESFVTDSYDRYAYLRVGTQVANTPSINLYERCGFKVANAFYVLHAHVRNGKIIQ
jgi:ribosomal protein S18 acetylase RimI-like enzyme